VRVVYLSRGYTPHDHRFLSALVQSGQEVFSLRLEPADGSEARPLPPRVREIEWRGGKRPFSLVAVPGMVRDLRRVVKDLRPDLIHAGPIQRGAGLAAWSGFRPIVAMSWGSDLLREAASGAGWVAARYALRRAGALACDCQAVHDAAIRLGMPEGRIVVFPWGVDLEHFCPGEDGGLRSGLGWANEIVLLSTRSWERVYGILDLVDGFVHAAKAEPRLRLLMLGSGSLGPSVRSKLGAARLLDRVHFAGRVAYDDLPRHYRAADLYLSASHSDGSSISLLEAMACGLPAIVSNIPGNREWVDPNATGWLFAVADATRFAQTIGQAAAERGEWQVRGRQARATAEARADWSRNFPRLLDAYRMAIESPRVSAHG
jgi:glycosyltransferase involved in cell wall biosynthesis